MTRSAPSLAPRAARSHRALIGLAFVLLVVGMCHPPIARALSEDQNQPIRIQADRVTLDERKAVSIYEGNVVVTQGTMRLTADTVRVFADRRQLDRIVAEGNLAEFYQKTDKGEEVQAVAKQMEYRASDRLVILTGKAKLTQGPNSFASERIEYDTVSAVVNAGDDTGRGRVEVIILPSDAKELLEQ